MAGGTYFGAHTGLVLPYWAIRLALGTATAKDIPTPTTGICVDRFTNELATCNVASE